MDVDAPRNLISVQVWHCLFCSFDGFKARTQWEAGHLTPLFFHVARGASRNARTRANCTKRRRRPRVAPSARRPAKNRIYFRSIIKSKNTIIMGSAASTSAKPAKDVVLARTGPATVRGRRLHQTSVPHALSARRPAHGQGRPLLPLRRGPVEGPGRPRMSPVWKVKRWTSTRREI